MSYDLWLLLLYVTNVNLVAKYTVMFIYLSYFKSSPCGEARLTYSVSDTY